MEEKRKNETIVFKGPDDCCCYCYNYLLFEMYRCNEGNVNTVDKEDD